MVGSQIGWLTLCEGIIIERAELLTRLGYIPTGDHLIALIDKEVGHPGLAMTKSKSKIASVPCM
jgi:hypothetical protein